jgi:hypothetical protein
MKTALLTLPLHSNYGGILQAYALQEALKRMGHEAILIKENSRFQFPLWKYPKRVLCKYILRKKDSIDVFYEQKREKLGQNTRIFIDKNIQTKDFLQVKKNKKDFGAIIVGSDQIWRPKYYKNIEKAYLSFAKNWKIKRIAYAASFGTDEWEYTDKQTENCKNLLKLFDAVSIREKSGVELCKKHFDINAVQVLDPTMLLDVSHYISLIEKEKVEKSMGNLFVYVLNKNKVADKIEQEISSTLNLIPFYSSTDSVKALIADRKTTKVENWLRSFYDAEFVLTDSFHACVFSILFNKPFVVYGNSSRGLSRFDSLLQLFNLENREISTGAINLEQILNSPVNWSKVNKIIEEQREISNLFLTNSLKER